LAVAKLVTACPYEFSGNNDKPATGRRTLFLEQQGSAGLLLNAAAYEIVVLVREQESILPCHVHFLG